jgi:hypothetical protein
LWLCRRRRKAQQSPPCRLLIDGPANGFPVVQRAELRYATGGDVQTLCRRDCGCRQVARQVEASSGGCEKTSKVAILPMRRQTRYAISKWWMCQGQFSRVLSVNDKEVMSAAPTCSLQLLAQSDRARKSGNPSPPPISLVPSVATSQLAMSAACLASVESFVALVRSSPNRSRLVSTSGGPLFSASRRL